MKIDEFRKVVTQEYVRARLSYSCETGVFTWRSHPDASTPSGKARVGKRAGSVQNRGGYLKRCVGLLGTLVPEHQLAWFYMKGEWPDHGYVIDHINRQGDDNRWCNLRIITFEENTRNASLRKDNSSGFSGVSWYPNYSKWVAHGTYKNITRNLGYFDEKEDAVSAVKSFRELHGFSSGHGEKRQERAKPVKTLEANTPSGYRYISMRENRDAWVVTLIIQGKRVRRHAKDINEAKRTLKEMLDKHPEHPYHGVDFAESQQEQFKENTYE